MRTFQVITRPGYGHGNKLTVVSTHKTKEAAEAAATKFHGYMAVELSESLRKGDTVFADSLPR